MNKLVALTAALLMSTEARMSFGECPTVDNVTTLDKTRYAGKWYQIEGDMTFPYTMGASCVYKDFTVDSNNDLDLWFGQYSMFRYLGGGGKMYCSANSEETCTATMGGGDKSSANPFPVLAPDYETYDIGYYCMDMIKGFMKADFVMVNSRQPTMEPATLEKVRGIIREKVPEYAYDWQLITATS